MSDSEQQQNVSSLIDQQTDNSDLTDPEIIEADPAVQQIIESDIIDNNSSNDTNDSGNESPQQQQQQHGPVIQNLGPEDEIHEEQGPGQEYQVEEPGEGPTDVQHTAPQQAVQQQPAALGGQTGNVIEYHVHYYGAPVYQGSVIKGDIVGSKSQVRGSTIGAIGGSQEPPAIGGPGGQTALPWYCEGASGSSQVPVIDPEQRPALPWHGEGTSGSSQVPAIGGPEQRPALPWHEEGERGEPHPGSYQPLAMPAPEAQISSSGNEQLEEIETIVPTNEPEILDPIKPKKISKKRPNREGSSRDPVPMPSKRPYVDRSCVDEKTLNPNVTTSKVIGIPTASNPEISGAFPLIPPEPSKRRNKNETSGARSKTTGSQPSAIGGPGDQAALAWLGEGASGSSQVPAVGGPEQRPALPWHGEGERQGSNRDVPTPRSPAERGFVDEETLNSNVTTPKVVGSPTASNPEIPEAFPPEPSNRRDTNVASGARPKTTDQQSRPTAGQIEPKNSPPHPGQTETGYSMNSQSDRSSTNNSSYECHINLNRERDGMNRTDQTQPSGRELPVKERDTSDKKLQTDIPNYSKEYETSVLKMTEIYKEERDIQTASKLKSLLPFIEIFWTRFLCTRTMAGYNRPSGAPGKLWSNFTDEITCDRGSEITMKPYISKIKDVMKLGDEFVSSGKYIHAIVAFYAAAKLHRQSGKDNESVKDDIWTCFDRAGFVAEKMQKSVQTANLAQNHVIPIMQEMTDFLMPIHSQSQFAKELEKKSEEFIKEKKFISATVKLYIAAKLHKEANEGDDSAHGVLSCIEQISLVMVEMIKQKQTKTLGHVISLITEMTDFIGMIEISNYSQFTNEIIGKATKFNSEEKFIPSVISFYVSAKLHGLNNKGVQSVIGIHQSVYQIQLVVGKMTKQHSMKKIVIDHVIPIMHELLEILRTIKGSTHKVRVEREAWCLFNIGLCYSYCDEHQQDANINNSAIILIERQLEEPQTYLIYGICLNNAGVAYERMGNIEKAIELYKMSLKAKMNAEDYPSDKDKNESIELTRKNLRREESKLLK
ncbi:uncharacterized protein LOC120334033 [Styela clava]